MRKVLYCWLLTLLSLSAPAADVFESDVPKLKRSVRSALAANDPALAQQWLEQWRYLAPRDVDYLQLQSHVYNLFGAPAAAIETATLALDQPNLPPADRQNLLVLRAQSMMLCGEYLAASRQFSRLLASDSLDEETRGRLDRSRSDAMLAYYREAVLPAPMPRLDLKAAPASVPADQAYLMLLAEYPPHRTMYASAQLTDWSKEAALANPDSPELAYLALRIHLNSRATELKPLTDLPGFKALPSMVRDQVAKRIAANRGSYDGGPYVDEEELLDGPGADAALALVDQLRQHLTDTEAKFRTAMAERDAILADVTALTAGLEGLEPADGLGKALDGIQARIDALTARDSAWEKAYRDELVKPLKANGRELSYIQRQRLVPAARLTPVLESRKKRLEAIDSYSRQPAPLLNTLRHQWVARYLRLRFAIATEKALAAEDWQGALYWSRVYLACGYKPNAWLYRARLKAAEAAGDRAAALQANVELGELEPDNPAPAEWFAAREREAGQLLADAAAALADKRLDEVNTLLTQAALYLPNDPRLLAMRYQLAEALGDASMKAEVLRDCFLLYEPLPVSDAEAMSIAVEAADWSLLLALSEDDAETDFDHAFYHYIAARALNFESTALGMLPIARGSRYVSIVNAIEKTVSLNVRTTRLDAEPRRAHEACETDPARPLDQRVLAARALRQVDGTPLVAPLRAGSPFYVPDGAELKTADLQWLAPGQRLVLARNASITSMPRNWSVLRLHGTGSEVLGLLRIDNKSTWFHDDDKAPSLRLLEVRHTAVQFADQAPVPMGEHTALTIDRGGVYRLDEFGGHGLVRGGILQLKTTNPTAELLADYASIAIGMGRAIPLAGRIAAHNGLLMMPPYLVDITAGTSVTFDNMALCWTALNPKNETRLKVTEGAAFTCKGTKLIGLATGQVELPAGTELPGCTTYGEPDPLLIGGQPGSAPTHHYLPVTFAGATHRVDTLAQLLAAIRAAKPGDTIELKPGVYEIAETVSLPNGIRLRGTGRADIVLTTNGGTTVAFDARDAGVRLENLRFRIENQRVGDRVVYDRPKHTVYLALNVGSGKALLANCAMCSNTTQLDDRILTVDNGGLAVVSGGDLWGDISSFPGAEIILRATTHERAEALRGGTIRTMLSTGSTHPLDVTDKAMTLLGASTGVAFHNGAGDPLARQSYERAVAARDQLWEQARTAFALASSKAGSVGEREQACRQFHKAVYAADISETWAKTEAGILIAKTANPLLATHSAEAGRLYQALGIHPMIKFEHKVFDQPVMNAINAYNRATLSVGLEASQEEKDKAAAFFRRFPPGSPYFGFVCHKLDEQLGFDEIVKAVDRKQKLDEQARVATIRAAEEAKASRLAQIRRLEREHREAVARAREPVRMSWQEAYEQYKASRPPTISSQQLSRLRQRTIAVLKSQNEQYRMKGLRPLYRIP